MSAYSVSYNNDRQPQPRPTAALPHLRAWPERREHAPSGLARPDPRALLPGTGAHSVVLRPLHRLDLPGPLVARFDDTWIEFRMNERWDSAIGDPVVLLHRADPTVTADRPRR